MTAAPSAQNAAYFRNFIFGVEDSLVSTVGLLAGIVAAGAARSQIILTGVVLICVEGFSMGVGSFLSERSAQEYMAESGGERMSARAAVIMLFSYCAAGLVPLFPYILWEPGTAFWLSIIFSIVALLALGLAGGRTTKTSVWKSGLRMALLGGIAIAIGAAVGTIFKG